VIRVIASGVVILALEAWCVAMGADAPATYRSITLREFKNEGMTLAAQSARIEITGAYTEPGTIDLLYADRTSAVSSTKAPENEEARRISTISLLTDQASHGVRAALLDCRTRKDVGCQVVLRGQVTMCTITTSLGSSQPFPCLDVRDGRLLSSDVSPGLGLLERAQPTAAVIAVAAPENPARPSEPGTPPPARPVADATCYGYVGFISDDGKFAVSVVGPFSTQTCAEQFNAMKTTVPSPIEGGRMSVSDHGNARTIEATVRYGLHCERGQTDTRGLTGIYQCHQLGH
jgi:hypothetical protein